MISFKGAHFPKDVIDFMLFEHRDEAAATAFFKQAIVANGFPKKLRPFIRQRPP